MSRHEALIPLSHDHHRSLVLALRLKKSGPASANDRSWPGDPLGHSARAIEFAQKEILPHFAIEEAVLFPAAESNEKCKILAIRLRSEHDELRGMLARLATTEFSSYAALLDEFRAFGSLLEQHIRREEREFFPAIQAALSQTALARIGEEIAIMHEKRGPDCEI